MLGLSAVLASPKTSVALSVAEYFSVSYDLKLSATEVNAGDSFNVIVTGSAVCKKNLPLTVSSVTASSRIIAENQDTGTRITLNSGYSVTLSPFPSSQGQSLERSVTVPLAFPASCASGTYTVIGELVDAKAKVGILPSVSVTEFLPSTQAIGTVVYHGTGSSAPGGGGGGGGGAIVAPPTTTPAPPARPGVLDVKGYVSGNGTFLQPASPQSADGTVHLAISENTSGLLQSQPLQEITVTRVEETLPATANTAIVGVPYRLGPHGAKFVPPITLTFTYSDNAVPTGANETAMRIALWDESVDPATWAILEPCTVDPVSNSITVSIDHFSVYAILAGTRPAAFTASDLKVSPSEATLGQQVSISAKITNTGDLASRHVSELVDNGWTIGKKEVMLAGGGSAEVYFTYKPDMPGSHAIDIDGLKGTFTVKALPKTPPASSPPPAPASFTPSDLTVTPSQVHSGEPVTIRLFIRNTGDLPGTYHLDISVNNAIAFNRGVDLDGHTGQEIIWSTASNVPGSYAVSAGGLAGSFTVIAKPPRLWPIAGIVGGTLSLAAAAVIFITSKRRKHPAD